MQTIQYRKSRFWEMKEDKYRLCQESGLCNMLDARYSEKRFTQIYKALYGNVMFIWPPETNRNIHHVCFRVFQLMLEFFA